MPKEKHYVDPSAHVSCSLRGRDVDIEVCLACSRLEHFDLDSRRPYLVCRRPDVGDREPGIYRAPEMA
jgi:hypothetical protein